MAIQLRISRAQNDETRLGRVFPVQEHHNTQATLQRLVPHDGGIQMQMRGIFGLLSPGSRALRISASISSTGMPATM